MLIWLTRPGIENWAANPSQVYKLPNWGRLRPWEKLYPTVGSALRAATLTDEATRLAVVNCVPRDLDPLPGPYLLPTECNPALLATFLPTRPGELGVDFAVAFGLCQLATAAKLHADGLEEAAAYFVEAAMLSVACTNSEKCVVRMERFAEAYNDDPVAVPFPDGIMWPRDVAAWLAGFGLDPDPDA